MNLIKLVKRRQPKGPWWFCVIDGNKIVAVTALTDLSSEFRKWVADCHAAGLDVDLVTEASAVGLLRRLHERPGPLVVSIRDVQP